MTESRRHAPWTAILVAIVGLCCATCRETPPFEQVERDTSRPPVTLAECDEIALLAINPTLHTDISTRSLQSIACYLSLSVYREPARARGDEAVSKRRQAGDRVRLLPWSGFVGESDRLPVTILPEKGDPEPCLESCGDPDCREWVEVLTDPDPKYGGRRHVLCHVSECRMLDMEEEPCP